MFVSRKRFKALERDVREIRDLMRPHTSGYLTLDDTAPPMPHTVSSEDELAEKRYSEGIANVLTYSLDTIKKQGRGEDG